MDFPNSTTLLTPVPHKIEYRIEERPPLFHHWPVFGMHIIIVFCLYVCLFIELHRNQAVYDPLSYPQSFLLFPWVLVWGFYSPVHLPITLHSRKTFIYFHFCTAFGVKCEYLFGYLSWCFQPVLSWIVLCHNFYCSDTRSSWSTAYYRL